MLKRLNIFLKYNIKYSHIKTVIDNLQERCFSYFLLNHLKTMCKSVKPSKNILILSFYVLKKQFTHYYNLFFKSKVLKNKQTFYNKPSSSLESQSGSSSLELRYFTGVSDPSSLGGDSSRLSWRSPPPSTRETSPPRFLAPPPPNFSMMYLQQQLQCDVIIIKKIQSLVPSRARLLNNSFFNFPFLHFLFFFFRLSVATFFTSGHQ